VNGDSRSARLGYGVSDVANCQRLNCDEKHGGTRRYAPDMGTDMEHTMDVYWSEWHQRQSHAAITSSEQTISLTMV
jgi:hypothetical protein